MIFAIAYSVLVVRRLCRMQNENYCFKKGPWLFLRSVARTCGIWVMWLDSFLVTNIHAQKGWRDLLRKIFSRYAGKEANHIMSSEKQSI